MLNSHSLVPNAQCVELKLPIHWDSTFNPDQLSPNALAYLGDAVYDLFIRTHYLLPSKRIGSYHGQVVAKVRAESQAECLKTLYPHLTDTEKEIVRRGRNAITNKPKRLPPDIYQAATSLETLIGYLYLQDPPRLTQLLQKISLEEV